MNSILYNNTIRLAKTSLDYTWQKIGVIDENIANSETPNYKSKTLSFENALRARLVQSKGWEHIGEGIDGKLSTPANVKRLSRKEFTQAIETAKPAVVVNNNDSSRSDGNNVEIDVENAELVRSQYQYQYMSRLLTDEFARLKTVITGQ